MPDSTQQPLRYCGVSEKLLEEARRRQAQWVNKRKLKWFVADRLPNLSLQVLTAAYAQAFGHWQAVCGLVFTQTPTSADADFLVLARRIDGASGTLAEHELPPGNDQQLRGWFDSGESWTTDSPPPQRKVDLVAVATHEFGHGIGLSHTNQPGNLLNPFYDPQIRTPQEWDIAEAQSRYGPPVQAPPKPTDPPVIPPGTAPDEIKGVAELLGGIYTVTFQRRL
jgi:hypothetical protein